MNRNRIRIISSVMLLLCAFTGCKNPLAEIIARDLTLSEIHIFSGASEISNGSEYSRNIATGSLDTSVSFTIKNQGERALCLTENPVTLTGSDADSFTITQPETLDLARQENCGFSVSVIDTSSPVLLSAEIRIASDDSYFPEFLVYLKVSVADIHVTGVEVSPSRIVLDPAGTCQLSAALQPSDATHQGYSWTSDSESVVTVDADGEITAVSQGQTTVTATTDDGSYTDSCSVLVRGWETSEHITEAVTSRIVYHPRIASNDSGTFFAVWYEQRSGDTSVYANRYTPGGGWGTAQPIEAGSGDAFDPDICTDGSGNALALWLQDDGTRVNVMSSAYTAGTGWGSEDAIETSDITATTPTIVMNDSGDAAAVWLHYDGSTYDLWTNLYTSSSGWGTSESLESGTWDVITSDAAIDSAGNVFVVWFQQSAASVGHIYARRYNSGTEEWEPAETIEADEDNSPWDPKIAVDDFGNAIAVWHEFDSFGYCNIWACRYIPGTGWESAELINYTESFIDTDDVDITMNDTGRAAVVWRQRSATYYSVWSTFFTPGNGWESPEKIMTGTADTLDAQTPRISIGSDGFTLAIWIQEHISEPDSVYENRYNPETGWGTAAYLGGDTSDPAEDPCIAMDASGNGMAAWVQHYASLWHVDAVQFRGGF